MTGASAISVYKSEHRPPPYRHLKQRPNRTGLRHLEEETRRGALRHNLVHLLCPRKDQNLIPKSSAGLYLAKNTRSAVLPNSHCLSLMDKPVKLSRIRAIEAE